MRSGWLLGVVLLGATGACGPHLEFPDGGILGNAGVGGGGGAGGIGGGDGGRDTSWTGEAGGSSGQSLYTWDDVAVRVVPATSTAASGLFFRMTDETGASTLSAALQYPPQTNTSPSDGAFVAAHYDCVGPNLYRVGLYSCPGQSSSDEQARDAGCLAVVFGAQGARGNFVTAAGVSCVIVSATATAAIDLPPAGPNVGQPGVASGKFTLECTGGDKTRLKFEGVFALPVVARFLTC